MKAAVDELRQAIEDVLGIVLYGSVARGDADRRSDIDVWVLVDTDKARSQRRANDIERGLEDQTYDDERYFYDIDVEEVASVPRYTDNICEIVLSGVPFYETDEFEMVHQLLMNEAGDEE